MVAVWKILYKNNRLKLSNKSNQYLLKSSIPSEYSLVFKKNVLSVLVRSGEERGTQYFWK